MRQLKLRSMSNRNFLIPKPKINLFKNSFSYSGALVWNSIPLWIKNSTVDTELKVTQSALDVYMGCTPFVKD